LLRVKFLLKTDGGPQITDASHILQVSFRKLETCRKVHLRKEMFKDLLSINASLASVFPESTDSSKGSFAERNVQRFTVDRCISCRCLSANQRLGIRLICSERPAATMHRMRLRRSLSANEPYGESLGFGKKPASNSTLCVVHLMSVT